jgi:hypothetical protein
LIKTITQIRVLQVICQASFLIAALCALAFLGDIFDRYSLSSSIGHPLEYTFLVSIITGLSLILIIRYLRCPVCHNVFVGKQEPILFANKCRYCGRSSGDKG